MYRPELNLQGKITNEFQEIKMGRRLCLEFPVFSSRCKSVSTVVLDSAKVAVESSGQCSCAALIVPRDREKEWVYSSEGGQWQLLASAGVSRLIVLFPKSENAKHPGSHKRLSELPTGSSEDEKLKTILRPLVLALSPKVLFNRGIPNIPFLDYTDDVAQRVEIEVAYSSLTGLMLVEDVELKLQCEEREQSSSLCTISAESSGREQKASDFLTPSTKSSKTWRRRLIFQRMPNLIQTEVSLIADPSQDADHEYSGNSARERKRERGSGSRRNKGFRKVHAGLKRVVDHGKLVHKYLQPIVAGFLLISPCLDEFVRSHHKAKVLCVGVGGGALPTFLHDQFGFHIKVVDLDQVVLDLARRHFGLKEGPSFEVIAGDGLDAVAMIAGRAVAARLGHSNLGTKRTGLSSDKPYERLSTSDSATILSYMEETNGASVHYLSSRTRRRSTTQHWQSVYDGFTDSECEDESKFTNDDARDANSAEDATTSRWSKLDPASQSTYSQQEEMDQRVEIIIVDVDASDARSELTSPPVTFLEQKFLMSAQIAMKEGGMLVMNVIASGKKAYEDVIEAVEAIFEEVYEILIENEAHHCVVFALQKASCYPSVMGPTVDLVQRFVDCQLVRRIRKLKGKNSGSTSI